MDRTYLFIDESGEPDFYAGRKEPLWLRADYNPFFLMGMLETNTRKRLRKDVIYFQQSVLNNPMLKEIHSVQQKKWFLHACKDHSDIRLKFFEFLQKLNYFSFYVVIARKIPAIFHNKHNSNPSEFYFDVVSKLIEQIEIKEHEYFLYLSKRQSTTEEKLYNAAHTYFETNCGIKPNFNVVSSNEYPELSVVDYLLWAVHRYLTKGEKRFFSALNNKYKVVYDIYGEEQIKFKGEEFDISKINRIK
jgi:hypothetical protein